MDAQTAPYVYTHTQNSSGAHVSGLSHPCADSYSLKMPKTQSFQVPVALQSCTECEERVGTLPLRLGTHPLRF